MKRWIMIALVVAVAVTIGAAALRPRHHRTITVMLPDSAGLFVGNDVGVLGIPVGRITALDPRGAAVVAHLEITDDSIKIPANAGAAVVTRSIAADRYLELTPVYDGGPTLADGAVIPASRTATPVDFDQTLHSLKRLGDGLTSNPAVTHDLRDFVDVSARTLRGKGSLIHGTTTSLSAAMTEVDSQRGTLIGTVRSLTALEGTLNANEGTVRTFTRNLAEAANLLSSERLSIGAALTALSASVDDVSALAREERTAIKGDVGQLTTVLRNTVHSQADLEEALDTLPLVGQNLQRAIDNGRLRLQMDPLALTPLGSASDQVCAQVPSLCQSVLTVPPSTSALGQLLGVLLNGAGR